MDKKGHQGPTKEEIRMNMAALQRIDPFITQILQSASQVALYKYVSSEWEKTDVEGALFVYKRKCEPYHGFLILNRRSANNWIQPLSHDIDTQIQKPFLLYKTKDDDIYGIWFYEEAECLMVGESLINLVHSSFRSQRPVDNGGARGDLAALLQRASHDNNDGDKRQPGNATVSKPSPSGGEKLLRLLSREPDMARVYPDPNSNAPSCGSVAAFFAQASQQEQNPMMQFQIGANPPPAIIPGFIPPGHQPSGPIFPFNNQMQDLNNHDDASNQMLQNLLANQGVVSVESLERAQRAESRTPSEMPPMPLQATRADDLEADLKNKLNLSPNKGKGTPQRSQQQQQPLGSKVNKGHKPAKSPQVKQTNQHKATNSGNQISYASALISGVENPNRTHPAQKQMEPARSGFYPTGMLQAENPEPEISLMSPMVFAALDLAPVSTALQTLNGHGGIEPLTRGQFVQAFVHLLHTDDHFVGKLHQAYVESLNTKLH